MPWYLIWFAFTKNHNLYIKRLCYHQFIHYFHFLTKQWFSTSYLAQARMFQRKNNKKVVCNTYVQEALDWAAKPPAGSPGTPTSPPPPTPGKVTLIYCVCCINGCLAMVMLAHCLQTCPQWLIPWLALQLFLGKLVMQHTNWRRNGACFTELSIRKICCSCWHCQSPSRRHLVWNTNPFWMQF